MTRRRPATAAELKAADKLWRWLHEGAGDPPGAANDCGPLGGASEPRETQKQRNDDANTTVAKDPAQERSVYLMRKRYRLAESSGYRRALFLWLFNHMNPQPLRRRG